MESEEPEIKSKQASKRDRTLTGGLNLEVISAHILENPSIVEAPKKEVLEQSKLSIP